MLTEPGTTLLQLRFDESPSTSAFKINVRRYSEEQPRFLAVLRVGAGTLTDSHLGVVETNQFKHLSHISLRFSPGDDAALKQYLAARLLDVREERNKWREVGRCRLVSKLVLNAPMVSALEG